jgi:hypothetical protein
MELNAARNRGTGTKICGTNSITVFSVVKTVLSGYTLSSLAVAGGRSLSNTSWSFLVDDPVPPGRFSTFLASSFLSLLLRCHGQHELRRRRLPGASGASVQKRLDAPPSARRGPVAAKASKSFDLCRRWLLTRELMCFFTSCIAHHA